MRRTLIEYGEGFAISSDLLFKPAFRLLLAYLLWLLASARFDRLEVLGALPAPFLGMSAHSVSGFAATMLSILAIAIALGFATRLCALLATQVLVALLVVQQVPEAVIAIDQTLRAAISSATLFYGALVLSCFALFLLGPGSLSLDALIRRWALKPEPAPVRLGLSILLWCLLVVAALLSVLKPDRALLILGLTALITVAISPLRAR
jgi:uncharacterized membrane protein YphA (DoxX/SURF4 family)